VFEQTFTATQKTRREQTIALAVLAQTALVTGLGLLPLLRVEPLGQMKEFVVLPPAQRTPPPDNATPPKPRQNSGPKAFSFPLAQPVSTGRSLSVALEEMGPPGPLTTNSAGYEGIPFSMPGGEIRVVPPTRPAPLVKPAPVRLTSTIAESQLIYGPKPAYPRLAAVSRSEGTVKLQAIISREGKIENLHLVSGPALLVGAAMEAVQTWRYRPLLLNGEPVEVITEIDVIFTLQR
jgi:protein TonB